MMVDWTYVVMCQCGFVEADAIALIGGGCPWCGRVGLAGGSVWFHNGLGKRLFVRYVNTLRVKTKEPGACGVFLLEAPQGE